MDKNISDVIKLIVKDIPDGKIFDSHFVIEQLFLNYPDLYLSNSGSGMNNWHSQISVQIDAMQSPLDIERLDNTESWSMNLLHNACSNAVWKKK